MNKDFITKTTTPTTEEYLAASAEDLVRRMNLNPSGLQSELPFIQAILDFKNAEDAQKANRNLLCATWILLALAALQILIMIFGKK